MAPHPNPGSGGFGGEEPADRARLLIVEDDAISAMMLETIVGDLGHEVCGIAATATEAVRLAEQHRPDLVLMDIRLADGSSGIVAATEIRTRLDVPSLFVTAHNDAATAAAMMAAKPVGLVAKPYSSAEIEGALGRALANGPNGN